MLIILDRSARLVQVLGRGIAQDTFNHMATYGAHRHAQIQQAIEALGIPAEMFRGSPTFRGVTTGRTSSSIPNMSQGSVRQLNRDSDEEPSDVIEAGY